MDITKLHKIANYHLSKIRTNCKFVRIVRYKERLTYISFYGLYQCKRRVIVKKIKLTYDGQLKK